MSKNSTAATVTPIKRPELEALREKIDDAYGMTFHIASLLRVTSENIEHVVDGIRSKHPDAARVAQDLANLLAMACQQFDELQEAIHPDTLTPKAG